MFQSNSMVLGSKEGSVPMWKKGKKKKPYLGVGKGDWCLEEMPKY